MNYPDYLSRVLRIVAPLFSALLFLGHPLAAGETEGELHPRFDAEVRQVLSLARAGEWSQAQELADALQQQSPDDPRLQRLSNWVQRERTRRADRHFERELDALEERDPRYSPTLREFLFPREPRRLPLPADLREALEREEERRLIPESYGQVEARRPGPDPSDALRGKLEQRIDVELEDATVREALAALRSATGINLAIAGDFPALHTPVSLHLEQVEAISVLEYLARNFDIRFILRDEMIWVLGPP
jgi:hypothetical protein